MSQPDTEPSPAAQRAAEEINQQWTWDISLDKVAAIIDRHVPDQALRDKCADYERTLIAIKDSRDGVLGICSQAAVALWRHGADLPPSVR